MDNSSDSKKPEFLKESQVDAVSVPSVKSGSISKCATGEIVVTVNMPCSILLDGQTVGRIDDKNNLSIVIKNISYGSHTIVAEGGRWRGEISEFILKEPLVKVNIELSLMSGNLYAKSEIGAYKLMIGGNTYECPTVIRNLPFGIYHIFVSFQGISIPLKIYFEATQNTDFTLTQEILDNHQAQQKKIFQRLISEPTENTLEDKIKLVEKLEQLSLTTLGALHDEIQRLKEEQFEENETIKRERKQLEDRQQWIKTLKLGGIILFLVVAVVAFGLISNHIKYRAEQQLWEQAEQQNSVAAYWEYLNNYPNGRHANEARKAFINLQLAFISRKLGQTITISLPYNTPLEMTYIPAGTFMMGSPNSEKGRYDNEGPRHKVTISKPFFMGKYEVTQAQWQAVMENNPSHFKGANRPVEGVSWDDCQNFIRELNRLTGKHFRLPAEAEWEYACRAGTDTAYSWGDSSDESIMKQYCWYEKNADDGSWTAPHAGQEGTQPVGTKKPNAWGLYDMHGNVWEWCSDWYDENYYKNSPTTDPRGPSSGFYRVIRGGSWVRIAMICQSAFRARSIPSDRGDSLGFRLVIDVE